MGLPLPGATALITAGALAASGKMNIIAICVMGIALTIVGANIAYALGARFGIRLLVAPGPFARHRGYVLTRGRPVVERYGWLAVLVNRSVPVLRECAPLLVGALGMAWKRFFAWTSLGGLVWALAHALLGYFVGRAVGTLHALIIIAIAEATLIAVALSIHYIRRRLPKTAEGDLELIANKEG